MREKAKELKPRLVRGYLVPRAEARDHDGSNAISRFIFTMTHMGSKSLSSTASRFSPEYETTHKFGVFAPKWLWIFNLSFVLLLNPLHAQEHSNFFPILGGQRAGTSAYTFLKIGVGARAMAMGGSFIAVANDGSSLFWNPAGAVQTENTRSIFVDHNAWFAGLQSENLSISYKFRGIHSLGISATSIHTDAMEITTEYLPDGTGEYFNYGDMMFGLSYAMKMTDRFSFGITGKVVDEQLAELHMVDYLVDLGTYYYTGFQQLRFAVALVNFGLPAAPGDFVQFIDANGNPQKQPYESFSPPTIFRLGIANEWLNSPNAELTTSIQLNHPVDNAENVSLGAELGLKRTLYLRGGYQLNMDVDTWSAGFGLRMGGFLLDYAYTNMRDLNNVQRFSLGWTF